MVVGFSGIIVSRRLKLSLHTSLLVIILLVSQAVSAYTGAKVAQEDKYARFNDPEHPRPICGEAEVLGTISDKLLVVRWDGSKALYTDDCKLSMKLPVPTWLSKNPAAKQIP
jgi:hypothetical protein